MAMTGNDAKHGISGINVTPLIDVLLVLLIIFMVIVPVTSHGLSSSIPQSATHAAPQADDTVVVQVMAGPGGELRYLINQTPYPKAEMERQLAGIFAVRQQKVMFVKADPWVEYASVVEVIDMARRASVDTIGLLTPGTERRR
jgi:biopolymer transport protein ExbD